MGRPDVKASFSHRAKVNRDERQKQIREIDERRKAAERQAQDGVREMEGGA